MTTRKNEVCSFSSGRYYGSVDVKVFSDEKLHTEFRGMQNDRGSQVAQLTGLLLDRGYELFATHAIHDNVTYVYRKVVA